MTEWARHYFLAQRGLASARAAARRVRRERARRDAEILGHASAICIMARAAIDGTGYDPITSLQMIGWKAVRIHQLLIDSTPEPTSPGNPA